MIRALDLSVTVGDRDLLRAATFDAHAGEKVGLVGRNGAGKTTLLRTISGARRSAAGRVVITGPLGFLPQDPRVDAGRADERAMDYVLSSRGLDAQRRELEQLRHAMESDSGERAIARYSRAEEQFLIDGGYRAEADVYKILAGLGLAADRA
ncbi:MAG TPA: ATP-binding cassette domain-containing protein, partial [Acidimicrobiia bacterium]|nr:ATP-binding cassette domain-containing protein [Acidimicrobiia bacterium]